MENFKTYRIDTKDDAIVYLRFIIINVGIYLNRLKSGIDALLHTVESGNLRIKPSQAVAGSLYFEIRDRIGFNVNYLLNIIGDHSNNAVSYKKFRALVDKKSISGEVWGLTELEVEFRELLHEFNIARNWVMHVPESLIFAALESIERATHCNPKQYIVQHSNPVGVETYINVDGTLFLDLLKDKTILYGQFSQIYQRMKEDYSSLIGEDVMLRPVNIGVMDRGNGFEMAEDSWAMQNKKY